MTDLQGDPTGTPIHATENNDSPLITKRNSYNNPDGIELFDEFSDENFIDDDDTSSDDDSSQKGGVQSKSSSDGTDDEQSETAKKPISRKTRNQRQASSDARRWADDGSDSEDELARPLKAHKQRLRADLLSESETGSESSGEDFSLSVRKKKWHGKAPIQSDGSSDDDEDQPEASIPDPSGSSPDETGTLEEAKEQNCNGDGSAADKLNEGESGSESEESFIATSSDDSPDSENVSSDWDEPRSNKPSHEELICNYRQKKRRITQPANKKKRRVRQASSSDSSTPSDDSASGASIKSEGHSERPLSKRAKRLRRKKDAWKTEVLGSYQNEREKKLSKKIDTSGVALRPIIHAEKV